jgi:hypothetical protein
MSDIIQKIVLQADASQHNSEMRKAKSSVDDYSKSIERVSGQRIGGTGGGGVAADPFAAAVSAPSRDVDIERSKKDHQDQVKSSEERQGKHDRIFGKLLQSGAQGGAGIIGNLSGGNFFGAVSQGLGTLGSQAGMLGTSMSSTAMAAGAALAVGAIAVKVANNLADKEYARMAPLFTTGLAQRLGVGNFESMISTYYWQGLKTGMPEEMTMRLLAGYSAGGGSVQAVGKDRNAGFAGASGLALQLAGKASMNIGVESQTMGQYLGLLNKLGVNMAGGAANNSFYAQGLNAFGIPDFGRFVEISTSLVRDMETRMRASDIKTSDVTNAENRIAALGAFGGFSIEGAAAIEGRVRSQRMASSGLGRPEDVMSFMVNRKPGEDVVDTMMKMRNPQSDYLMFDFIKKTTPDKIFRYRVMEYFNVEPESVDGFIATMNAGMGANISGKYAGVPELNESYKGARLSTQLKQWDIMGLPEKWMSDVRNSLLRNALYQATGIDIMGDLAATDAAAKAVSSKENIRAETASVAQADVETRIRAALKAKGYSQAEIEDTMTGILGQINYQTSAAFGTMTTAEQYQMEYLKEMRDFLEQIAGQGKDPKKTTTDQQKP